MTTPALVSAPVLVDYRARPGASTRSLDAELLDRVTRDDYQHWLSTALAAGGCVRRIRLRGTVRDIDAATGEILRDLDTSDLPVILLTSRISFATEQGPSSRDYWVHDAAGGRGLRP